MTSLMDDHSFKKMCWLTRHFWVGPDRSSSLQRRWEREWRPSCQPSPQPRTGYSNPTPVTSFLDPQHSWARFFLGLHFPHLEVCRGRNHRHPDREKWRHKICFCFMTKTSYSSMYLTRGDVHNWCHTIFEPSLHRHSPYDFANCDNHDYYIILMKIKKPIIFLSFHCKAWKSIIW